MRIFKKITNQKFRNLNKKSNKKGLNTHELLQVLDRMIEDKPTLPNWKNQNV